MHIQYLGVAEFKGSYIGPPVKSRLIFIYVSF